MNTTDIAIPVGAAHARLWRRAHTLLLLSACAPAAIRLADLGQVFWSRLDYPMDIDWIESLSLLQAQRVLQGLTIYGPPTDGFLPQPYPPGHMLALALCGWLFGLDYGTGRALSALCLILCAVWSTSELRRSFGGGAEGWAMIVVAWGTIAAGFSVTGGEYDLVRTDAMALALPVLGALLLGDGRRTARYAVAAALVLAAAVFVKQTGVFFVAWLCAFQLLQRARTGILLTSLVSLLCLALLGAAYVATEGWFWTYVFSGLQGHPVVASRAHDGLRALAMHAPYVAIPGAALLLSKHLKPTTWKWLGMLGAAVPASLLPYMKLGGYLNNLMPIVVLVGPVTLFVLADALLYLKAHPGHWPARISRGMRLTLPLAGAVYLLCVPLPGATFSVSASQYQDAVRLNQFIADLPGPVVIPNHPFLAERNGKAGMQIHSAEYHDALLARRTDTDLTQHLRRAHVEWAILTHQEPGNVAWPFRKLYRYHSEIPVGVSTMTGMLSSPRFLYVRRRPA